MAENIKIYRSSNPRMGFQLNEASVSNILVDEEGLRKLVAFINHQFLTCSNRQAKCLLDGCIDPHHRFTSLLAVAIILPLATAILLNDYSLLLAEYLLVFLGTAFYLYRQISLSSKMKEEYLQAEEELEGKFKEIQEEFNRRFDYLQMEYVRGFEETGQDYLQIRVVKIPQQMHALEERMRREIKLAAIED